MTRDASPLQIATALAIGGAGTWLFARLGLPVPPLSGAMTAVALAAILGLNCDIPIWMRDLGLLMSGVALGSTVTPEALDAIQRYPLSLVGLAVNVCLVVGLSSLMLTRMFRWDTSTAFLSSVPGALSIVMAMAVDLGADVRRVAVLQSIRLFVMMTILPGLITMTPVTGATPAPVIVGAGHMAILFALAVAGAFWLQARGIQNAMFLSGMVISMVLHVSGVMVGTLPAPVGDMGMYIIGVFCGLRFAGTNLRALAALLTPSFVSLVMTLTISALSAYAVHLATGIRLADVLVAFSPGALEAMILLGAALGLDTLYISTHHILRTIGLNAVTPFFALRTRNDTGQDGAD